MHYSSLPEISYNPMKVADHISASRFQPTQDIDRGGVPRSPTHFRHHIYGSNDSVCLPRAVHAHIEDSVPKSHKAKVTHPF